jgi:integrase
MKDARGKPVLSENPTEGVEWPAYTRPVTRFLYRDELLAFLSLEVPIHEAVARELFVETGLRVSELVRADVEHLVEGPGGAVSLAVTVKGKGRRVELVHTPLSPALVGLLKDWLLHRNMPDGGEPLLVSSQEVRWTRAGLTEMIRRLGEKAGITRLPVRPHILRHTANVIARGAGIDPFVRSKLLHHRSPQSLERYEHLLPDELHQARERTVEGLASYLGEPRPSMTREYVDPLETPDPTLRKDGDAS